MIGPADGPIHEESDARVWGGVNEERYPFEVQAETFAFGPDAATGQDDALVLEAGDEYVDYESRGRKVYAFRHAERRTDGGWSLVWDIASSDVSVDGQVTSGSPSAWATKIREGELVSEDEYGQETTGVLDL